MDANSIVTTIQAVGFPIAACVALYLHMVHQLREAINNNTMVMQRLLDKLGGM